MKLVAAVFILCILNVGISYSQNENNSLNLSVGLITTNEVIAPITDNSDKIPHVFCIDYSWNIIKHVDFLTGISFWQFTASRAWDIKTSSTTRNLYSYKNAFMTANLQAGIKLSFPLLRLNNKYQIGIYTLPQYCLRPIALDRLDYDFSSLPYTTNEGTTVKEKSLSVTSWFHSSFNEEFGISFFTEGHSFNFGCFVNNMDVFSELRKKQIDNYSLQNVLPSRQLNWGVILRVSGEL